MVVWLSVLHRLWNKVKPLERRVKRLKGSAAGIKGAEPNGA